jgi:hypothetical protein
VPFSGFQDLDPAFAASLQRMIAAQPGISVNSGYRTPERQAELYAAAVKKYGSEDAARHWVAPPGHSMHNQRGAADLAFADDAAKDWAHKNAAEYGLNFRMGHEPWHIEMLKGGGGGGALAAAQTGQDIPTTGGQFALPTEQPKAAPDLSFEPPPVPEQPAFQFTPPPAAKVAQAEVAPIATDQKMAQRQQLAQLLAQLNSNRVA